MFDSFSLFISASFIGYVEYSFGGWEKMVVPDGENSISILAGAKAFGNGEAKFYLAVRLENATLNSRTQMPYNVVDLSHERFGSYTPFDNNSIVDGSVVMFPVSLRAGESAILPVYFDVASGSTSFSFSLYFEEQGSELIRHTVSSTYYVSYRWNSTLGHHVQKSLMVVVA